MYNEEKVDFFCHFMDIFYFYFFLIFYMYYLIYNHFNTIRN